MAAEQDTADGDSDGDINPFTTLLVRETQPQEAAPANPLEQFHYLKSINTTIITRQLPSQGLSFQLWPAATTLVSLLDRFHSDPLSTPGRLSTIFNRRPPIHILELGSGTGLAGISAAAIFTANVTLTDLPHVLPNLNFNIDANFAVVEENGGKVNAEALCWGDNDHMEGFGRDYDLIMGSDLVYHDHLYEPLLKTLKFFLVGNEEKKVVFLMAHLRRWKKESIFFKKARKMFDIEIVHTDPPLHGARVGVVVYQFLAKGSLQK